ncbi:MAG: DUF5915 domain-containing protein, partial [Planctomycetota bacterium]
CWYDSGAMPFAQWGYPHAPGSKEQFAKAFPADFISEAIDQTRGWFYSLIAESTLLFSSTAGVPPAPANAGETPAVHSRPYPHPYKTCLVLGHVCDEKGEKMSKSKGNFLDPNLILAEEGADALRWFFYSSTNPWTSIRFSRAAVRDAQKEFLIKLRNVYSFFVIYANIDGFEPRGKFTQAFVAAGAAKQKCRTLLDDWILSEMHLTIGKVRDSLDGYDIYAAAQALNELVEALSNWYVRRSRERFWSSWQTEDYSSESDRQKLAACFTLHECLTTVAQLAAPFVPFMAEEMWRNLAVGVIDGAPESVHLCAYPEPREEWVNRELGAEIALVREVASLGRAARSGAKLKTRQPLAKVIVVTSETAQDDIIEKHEQVLLDELNVKAIEVAHQADQYVSYELKPNFKLIGAKHRELVPGIKAALEKANATAMRAELEKDGKALLKLATDKAVWLESDEVRVTLKAKEGYAAASEHHIVVVLDTHLTQDLLDEGVARELVNRINGWRSDLNLKYEQHIKLALKGSPRLEAVARKFADYVSRETLADGQAVGQLPEGCQQLEIEVDGEKGTLGMM